MNRYDLAIFDFDGTLADSPAWFRSVLNEIARRYRFREVADDEIDWLRGQSSAAILRHLGIPAWKLPFIARHARKLAARDAHLIRPFDGVEALLDALTAAGIRIAIVTSNTEANVRHILGERTSRLIASYGCGATMFGKAGRFRAVIRSLRAEPARTITIGDELRDLDAARQAGLAVGAVSWGYATPEALRAAGPDHLFTTMDDIRAVLTGR